MPWQKGQARYLPQSLWPLPSRAKEWGGQFAAYAKSSGLWTGPQPAARSACS